MSTEQTVSHDLSLSLSPSFVHERLMAEINPALAYDGGDVSDWQSKLRPKLRELLGYERLPRQKCPLNIRTLWQMPHELGTIEKLVYTSEVGSDVPAYLCLPNEPLRDPCPVFICLQGHSTGMHNSIGRAKAEERQVIEVQGDRDFALGCMKRGMAALCIEQRSFGERGEQHQARVSPHSTCHDAAMHALMLGRTLAGERVYDVDRGIDVLVKRGGFDMDRLGVMGNSGGGLIAYYAAAILDRVKLAMPSCSVCTYRESIMSIHHCSDNYVPSLLRFAESSDILGLIAPRPLVIVAGETDEIFPIAGVRRAFGEIKTIYRSAGAEDRCRLVVGSEGHRFYADIAWDAMLPYV